MDSVQHLIACVSYDGSALHGWQRQPGLATAQGMIEDAVSRVADHPVTVRAAGRTDRGVHATAQVIAFRSAREREVEVWQRALRGLTPDAIDVRWLIESPPGFHPRYSATARRYHYVFYEGADPFMRSFSARTSPLDADAMHRAAQRLLGEHDFTSFRGAGCQSLSPMRRVDRCAVNRLGPFVVLEIEANAFLLHMVRNIAAGLLAVGQGASEDGMAELLAARDRTRLGPTADPAGLFLTRVAYPDFALPEIGSLPGFLAR